MWPKALGRVGFSKELIRAKLELISVQLVSSWPVPGHSFAWGRVYWPDWELLGTCQIRPVGLVRYCQGPLF